MNIKRDVVSGIFYIDVEGERLWIGKSSAAERLSFPIKNVRAHKTSFGNLVLVRDEGNVLHSYTRFPPHGSKVSIEVKSGDVVLQLEVPIPLSNRDDLGARVLVQSKETVELIIEVKGFGFSKREKVLMDTEGKVSEFPEDEELLQLLGL